MSGRSGGGGIGVRGFEGLWWVVGLKWWGTRLRFGASG